jgi:hypothetical protein
MKHARTVEFQLCGQSQGWLARRGLELAQAGRWVVPHEAFEQNQRTLWGRRHSRRGSEWGRKIRREGTVYLLRTQQRTKTDNSLVTVYG